MDNMYLNFFILNNIEHREIAIQNVRVVKEKTMDPFLLSDRLFVKSFRLTKYLANILINMLRPLIEDTGRSSAIDLKTKVNIKSYHLALLSKKVVSLYFSSLLFIIGTRCITFFWHWVISNDKHKWT